MIRWPDGATSAQANASGNTMFTVASPSRSAAGIRLLKRQALGWLLLSIDDRFE
jgi:hypothetical protein